MGPLLLFPYQDSVLGQSFVKLRRYHRLRSPLWELDEHGCLEAEAVGEVS